MKIFKIALITALPLLVISIAVAVVTQSTKYKTATIEKHFGIELPDEVKIVDSDFSHGCDAHIIIPGTALDDITKSITQAEYDEMNEIDTMMGNNNIWDYNKSNVYKFYGKRMSKWIWWPMGTTCVNMEIGILIEDDGFLSLYFN